MLFKAKSLVFRSICVFLAFAVFYSGFASDILSVKKVYAAEFLMPKPGTLVSLSGSFSAPLIRGIKFDPANPFKLEFIVDKGDAKELKQEETARLVRYFLTALTVPENRLWVNLSPYESDRVIDQALEPTELGETLLKQDYFLKQLSSSLTHPDTEIGKKYWNALNGQAQGTALTDELNKIWISTDKVSIYDGSDTVMITDAVLKVETEADYKNINTKTQNQTSTDVVRDVLIPEITKDVNVGKNFAELRQLFYSAILAQWFKKKFANSLYSFYYNSEKIVGVDVADVNNKKNVFNRYVEAFEKGSYDYIKKERDPVTDRLVKRHYFSGGADAYMDPTSVNTESISSALTQLGANSQFSIVPVETILDDGTKQKSVSSAVLGTKKRRDINNRDLFRDFTLVESKRTWLAVDSNGVVSISMPEEELLANIESLENSDDKLDALYSHQELLASYLGETEFNKRVDELMYPNEDDVEYQDVAGRLMTIRESLENAGLTLDKVSVLMDDMYGEDKDVAEAIVGVAKDLLSAFQRERVLKVVNTKYDIEQLIRQSDKVVTWVMLVAATVELLAVGLLGADAVLNFSNSQIADLYQNVAFNSGIVGLSSYLLGLLYQKLGAMGIRDLKISEMESAKRQELDIAFMQATSVKDIASIYYASFEHMSSAERKRRLHKPVAGVVVLTDTIFMDVYSYFKDETKDPENIEDWKALIGDEDLIEDLDAVKSIGSSAMEAANPLGGIDLNGMLDGVSIKQSSSGISLSPDVAAKVVGVRFSFVGKTRQMPLKEILGVPLTL